MSYPNPYQRGPQYGMQYGMPNQYGGYSAQPSYQQQQPVHGFVYVTGLDGAKAYQMPPNSEMPLFDSTADDIMYIKTTDGAGYPTIKVIRCTDLQAVQHGGTDYATASDVAGLRAEVEELRGLVYAKHVSSPATDGRTDADAVSDQADGGR